MPRRAVKRLVNDDHKSCIESEPYFAEILSPIDWLGGARGGFLCC